MSGLSRNVIQKVQNFLKIFPAVVILGARQTGKTTLTKQIAPDSYYLDLEKPSHINQFRHDPEFFFEQHPKNLIIDEAQSYPEVFNILRGVIDENRNENGRFLITGSSSPDILHHTADSLAGRVGIIELGTLKANEYYTLPLSPFYQIFQQKLTKELLNFNGPPPLSTTELQHVWLKGGYPQPLLATSDYEYFQWMENYQATYINRDIAALFPKLNKIAYQRFLSFLSQLSSTIVNKSELARAIEVSESTIREYLMIAEGSFFWRQLNSFENKITKSIVKMPKGYIRDSGLLHYLLKIEDLESLYSNIMIGHSFESFVIEEIIKGLQATNLVNWQYYYYRTRGGAEIDCILQGPFGTLPIEIKFGSTVLPRQLRSLEDFIKANHLPFGLLINQSQQAKWLTHHIFQLPAGWI
jgi:predicted AAA+ superfamily ATPase